MLNIAIATMKRWEFLQESLPVFLDHPGINQVILCDETGEDAKAISNSPFTQNNKLRVIVNDRRLGIYQNKRKALDIAGKTAPYVAVLDSDNYFSEEWIDTILDVLKGSDGKTIFASADFKNVDINTGEVTFPCKHFSGRRLDLANWNSIFKESRCASLLNDGNWVLPSTTISCLPVEVPSEKLLAADAIYMLRNFVKGGYSIYYLPELSYIHTVHGGSSWLQTEQESTRILNTTSWSV